MGTRRERREGGLEDWLGLRSRGVDSDCVVCRLGMYSIYIR
jgi:hypothetical protein